MGVGMHVSIGNVPILGHFALRDSYTTYLKTATIYLEINIHCLHMLYYLLTAKSSLYILWPVYLLKAAIQSSR